MVEDTPDDLVHEIFTQAFWEGHPLGRPILGTKESVEAITQRRLSDHFRGAYAAENVIISAAGNLEHSQLREALEKAFGSMPSKARNGSDAPPQVVPKVVIRNKELEQSHVCLGTSSYPQNHSDRYCELRDEHDARRIDELSTLPEYPREARSRLFGVFGHQRVSRRGISHGVCRVVPTRPSAK